MADKKTHPKEHGSWTAMISRCIHAGNVSYEYYGGRGIKICERWLYSFECFLQDMGERPEPKAAYSLDRINNDGNYEPGNCRWADSKMQAANRRKNQPKKCNNKEKCIADSTTINLRIKKEDLQLIRQAIASFEYDVKTSAYIRRIVIEHSKQILANNT